MLCLQWSWPLQIKNVYNKLCKKVSFEPPWIRILNGWKDQHNWEAGLSRWRLTAVAGNFPTTLGSLWFSLCCHQCSCNTILGHMSTRVRATSCNGCAVTNSKRWHTHVSGSPRKKSNVSWLWFFEDKCFNMAQLLQSWHAWISLY